MTVRTSPWSLRVQIAVAVLSTGAVAVAVVALGVFAVAGRTFERLMADHGVAAPEAHEMFDESVTVVVALAAAAALFCSVALAVWVSRRISRPLTLFAAASRRISNGDYAARLDRGGPTEIAGVAHAFNQMALALEDEERIRSEFIANAAHELRTPLTNLTGYLEALRDGVIPPDRAAFDSLLEETARLVRLAHSLDVLARGETADGAPRPVELDLAAAVMSAVGLAMPAFERAGIAVRVGVPALRCHADPDVLAQVLANLVENALRYTPDGGTVTVDAAPRASDIVVTVANTGDGIPPEDLGHVFERFYRVEKSRDAARGGSGIGLAIVDQLVRRSGGRVGVESQAGWTRFWFTVPAGGQGGGRTVPAGG